MNTKDDGGSAFPVTRVKLDEKGVLISATPESGMSLRDWFAGMALSYCAEDWRKFCDSDNVDFDPILVADDAYEIADAMLAARKGGKDE